jgi:uncharacterized protein YjbI with pentapeptide repeats
MTVQQFLEAYKTGQRYFSDLDFENEGLSGCTFPDSVFENCYLYVDFCNSNLANTKFISCNLKFIDLRGANITNAFMNKCLVGCAMFQGAVLENFKFIENYYYGLTIGQNEFEILLKEETGR